VGHFPVDDSVYGGPADAVGAGDLSEALSMLAVPDDGFAVESSLNADYSRKVAIATGILFPAAGRGIRRLLETRAFDGVYSGWQGPQWC
jgi:hypothetical protein